MSLAREGQGSLASKRWLYLIVACFAAVAWMTRWLQDDAFITFRYARNWAEGLGPVWNQGDAVEGYTNFSWMALLAVALRLGIRPEIASQALGVLCFIGSLLTTQRLASRLMAPPWSLLAVFLLASNFSFLAYATGGLETQLNVFVTLLMLLLATDAVVGPPLGSAHLLALSLLVACALLTRPDSVIVSAVVGLYALFSIVRAPSAASARIARLALLAMPAALVVGCWLWWKWSFYGDLLPNTYYAKLGNAKASGYLLYARGSAYVAWFLFSFWLAPLALLVWVRARPKLERPSLALQPTLAFVVLWLLYVIHTGGDIMEFRQLLPAVPGLLILFTLLLSRTHAAPRNAAWIIASVLVASGVHGVYFPAYVRPPGIGNIPQLSGWVDDEPVSWASMGRTLGRDLDHDPSVSIAAIPVGAIGYYSRARTIDMVGLNDRWVARYGLVRQTCVVCYAHSRMASIEYLARIGANLVLSQPTLLSMQDAWARPMDSVRLMFLGEPMDYDRVPPGAQLVRVPLGDDVALSALYLIPHPRIEALLKSGRWQGVSLQESPGRHPE